MLHARMLRYLDEVARSGSMRLAAERLHVSATAINRQIIALERDVGAPLFHRLPRGVRLTAAGEVVVAHVRDTLKEHERMQRRLEQLRGVQDGHVRISAMHGVAGGVLRPVIANFRRNHPRVAITLVADVVEGVVRSLVTGEADIGLAYHMPDNPNLRSSAVFLTHLGVIVAPMHPLALRSPVHLAECLNYPIVLADSSLTIHRRILDGFARAGLPFSPDYLSNSVEFMKAMARSQEAITFLSGIDVAEDQREGALVFVAIQGDYIRRQELTLARRIRGVAIEPAVDLVEEEIRSALKRLSDEDWHYKDGLGA